ncbi:VOC family protein [Amnibacterium flavum]|uniref:Glyoxalase n=1 Tax=Amnibacterium flavum TaxID=2173173 RepID=A0A2V1HU41_9MICO|nr:VOC family protein [Amnibacterium flavum]PVZ96125.1 glyoxalase [Amnibacterium flavum]
MFRSLSTVSFYAADLEAAAKWYTDVLGVAPYFSVPGYIEFRVGDLQHELGIIDSAYAGSELSRTPAPATTGTAGSIVFWQVDDLQSTLDQLLATGATLHDAPRDRGEGFITASVIDPFGNILGIMDNPHTRAILDARRPAGG